MLRILIVEDDRPLATTLKYLVEDNPRYQVVAMADDLDSALAAVGETQPDLALVDLRLANGTTGFSVAVRLADHDVPVLFVTGKAPDFPMPDLALGCLMKPFTADEVHRSLSMAEDVMRGRERFRQRLPQNLTLYDVDTVAPREPLSPPPASPSPEPGYVPSRRSLRTRIEHWIAGTQG